MMDFHLIFHLTRHFSGSYFSGMLPYSLALIMLNVSEPRNLS